MRLPTLLSRRNPKAFKNKYGHILILSGSRNMLGACALCGLAGMRAGAGLVTLGIPKGLNSVVQKKISPVIMTLSLNETAQHTIAAGAYQQFKRRLKAYQALGIGPGLSQNPSTQKFILKIVESVRQPLVIDADGLNAVSKKLKSLTKTSAVKILTPHPGEMARLASLKKEAIEGEAARKKIAKEFAAKYNCIVVLKGHHTVVASPQGKIYINKSGNPGMATAGSGDVLTGMITAFLGQGLNGFEAAKWGTYLHGKAGDLAAKRKTQIAMIATDIIDTIPEAIKKAK